MYYIYAKIIQCWDSKLTVDLFQDMIDYAAYSTLLREHYGFVEFIRRLRRAIWCRRSKLHVIS